MKLLVHLTAQSFCEDLPSVSQHVKQRIHMKMLENFDKIHFKGILLLLILETNLPDSVVRRCLRRKDFPQYVSKSLAFRFR